MADENVPIGPVREAFINYPNASLSEIEADHLETLLTVQEEIVGLAE